MASTVSSFESSRVEQAFVLAARFTCRALEAFKHADKVHDFERSFPSFGLLQELKRTGRRATSGMYMKVHRVILYRDVVVQHAEVGAAGTLEQALRTEFGSTKESPCAQGAQAW